MSSSPAARARTRCTSRRTRHSARTTSTIRRTPRASSGCTASRAELPPAWPPSGRMSQQADTHHMWGGRFDLGPSEALDALNRSLPVDHRLWPQDVFASKAWVHALGRARVLSASEESQLLEGLDRVADKLADGAAVGAPDEDVHTLVERLLYAEVGAVAGKLHTGRSRNDQVATDLRLWTVGAIDATGDRDFVADVLFAIALIGTHLSRLGAELITYASGEYAFVTLSDAFSTGSSLMPQKRNPDVFELARGKAGRMLGDLVALLTTLKGIPAGYQKDLQEDKALLFDACDTLATVLPAVTGAIETLTINADRMAAALDPAMRATDLADLLVEAGVPFRESHGLIGRLVRAAEHEHVPLDRVPQNIANDIHPALGSALAQLGTWEQSVESRATPGGASRASVESQIEELRRAFMPATTA